MPKLPKNYVYAINDTQEMLQAVAQWYQRRYGVTLDADTEICSLLGSQDGLSHIALSILDAGDVMLDAGPTDTEWYEYAAGELTF